MANQPFEPAGQFGIARDAFPHELASTTWSRGQNVRFDNGYASRIGGHGATYGTPSVKPYFLQPYTSATGRAWIYAGANKIYSVSVAVHTNITRAAGGDYAASPGTWSGGVLGGIAVLNNPNDIPQYWAGTGLMQDLTAWNATWRAKVMRPFKSFLVAAGIKKGAVEFPHMVKWSHSAVPGSVPSSWDETDPTKDAGEFDLPEDQSKIVDALGLGDQFIVYKEGAFYALQYIGPPYIFREQKIASGQIGALSLNCAVDFPGGHVVIGQGDIVQHAGANPMSIVDGRMRSWFFNNLDSQSYQKSFAAHNFAKNEVWCCFPMVGKTSCSHALVWNYKHDTLTVRELPDIIHAASGAIDAAGSSSWNAQTEQWQQSIKAWNQTDFTQAAQRLVMASEANTKIYLTEYTSNFDGVGVSAYIEKEGMDFGDPSMVKTMLSVRPIIDAPTGTQIMISTGGAMDQKTGPLWNPAVPFTVGTDQRIMTFAVGRFLAIRFATSDGESWRLRRFDIEYEESGDF